MTCFAKVSKEKAKYTPHGTVREHCGICQHFTAPHECERVFSPVVRGGWCRFFLLKRVGR